MIEVEIFGDIKESKPKMAFGLTGRQIVCVILGAGACYASYCAGADILKLAGDLKFFFPVVAVVPFGLMGFIKPYGMDFEKFLFNYVQTSVLPPKKRLYMVENIYEKLEREIEKEEKEEALRQEKATKSKKGATPNGTVSK